MPAQDNAERVGDVDIDENKLTKQQALAQMERVMRSFGIRQYEVLAHLPPPPGGTEAKCTYILADDCQRIIIPFIITVVLAADWYDSHMQRSLARHRAFLVLSIALMGLLPLGLWVLSSGAGLKTLGLSAPNNVSAIAAILTGLLAIQKSLAAWMDNQTRFGNQWCARSALRDILYGLQTRWEGQATASSADGTYKVLSPSLVEGLTAATAAGRAAVRQEQQAFFNSISMPTPDILTGLACAQPNLQNLVNAFRASSPASPPKST